MGLCYASIGSLEHQGCIVESYHLLRETCLRHASRMLDLGSCSMVMDDVGSLVAEYRALGISRFGAGFGRSSPGIMPSGLKTVRYGCWLELPT